KAYLLPERGEPIYCLFNPAELTVSKSNSWQGGQSKGRNAPEQRFQSGQAATLSLSLTFDTTHDGSDVTIHTTKLLNLMKVDPDLPGGDRGRNSARPPWVELRPRRSEEHTSELQSLRHLVCRLLLEKK